MTLSLHSASLRASASISVLGLALAAATGPAAADETCMSPYLPKITGQEDYVYVWTLGVEGLGDGSDKLVTVAAPELADLRQGRRRQFGRRSPRGAPRRFHRRPPPLLGLGARQQQDLGLRRRRRPGEAEAGPHDRHFVEGQRRGRPAHVLRAARADADHGPLELRGPGGRTAMVEYNNDGEYVATLWMPRARTVRNSRHRAAEVRLRRARPAAQEPHADVVLHRLGQLHAATRRADTGRRGDEALRQHRGGLGLPRPQADPDARGARRAARDPLGLGQHHDYAFTTAALTSKLWLVYEDDQADWQAEAVADIGDPTQVPLPVDISLSADDRRSSSTPSWTARCACSTSEIRTTRSRSTRRIGTQVNMVSQTWDGKRVYFTSSLLANWDKKGEDNEQFLKAYGWDGKKLTSSSRSTSTRRGSAGRTSCALARRASTRAEISHDVKGGSAAAPSLLSYGDEP